MVGQREKAEFFGSTKFQCRPGVANGRNTASFWRPTGGPSAAMNSRGIGLFDSIEKQSG
jgi:hypothetical protein